MNLEAENNYVGEPNAHEVGEPNAHDVQPYGESSMHGDDELLTASNVLSTNLTVEEIESTWERGKIIENEHFAYALYCKYAGMKGFSVRKSQDVKKDGQLQAKIFVCSCEGLKDNKHSTDGIPVYQQTISRCGCKAMFKVSKRKDGFWRVLQFKKEHNHVMYPADQTYLLRSSRTLTAEQELMLTSMVKFGIPASQAIGYMESMVGGRENIGFMPQDAYDCLKRVRLMSKLDIEDSSELIQHFLEKSNNESNFYWNMEVDDDKRLMNFFFRDSRCMLDYESFSNVIFVDATYKTNKYGLIAVPFVGINHHNENILFGFAYMSDEKENSYEWLFRTFLASMGEKQPGLVFTDQCQAMMNAIQTVFPSARHRLCQWHINQNALGHFGKWKGNQTFKYLWEKCMRYCDSIEEFEETWKKLMDDYAIGEESWFIRMYKLRGMWASAFNNDIFSAGTFATSRSEGTNSALKKKITNCISSLIHCVQGYEKVQRNWRRKEKEKDTIGLHTTPSLFAKSNPLLKQAAEIYTLNIFKLFEKELRDTMDLDSPEKISNDGSGVMIFKVKFHGGNSRGKIVKIDYENIEVECSCHFFDIWGILCKHSLKFFDVLSIKAIPEKFIVRRWRKTSRQTVYVQKNVDEGSGRSNNKCGKSYVNEMTFMNHATQEFHDLATRNKPYVMTRYILMKYMENAKGEITAVFESTSLDELSACDYLATKNDIDQAVVKNPPIPKPKGITNIHKRHWEDTGTKKGAQKSRNVAAKQKDQSSVGNVCVPQKASNTSRYLQSVVTNQTSQYPMQLENLSNLSHDIVGQFSVGMEYGENANTYSFINLLQAQPLSTSGWRVQ